MGDHGERERSAQMPAEQIDRDEDDLVVPQQIHANGFLEPEIDDRGEPIVLGETSPAPFVPLHPEMELHQPVEILAIIPHEIGYLIAGDGEIELSPTVTIAHVDPYHDNDEDAWAIGIEDAPAPAEPIVIMIDEVIAPEPMAVDEPLDHHTNDAVAVAVTVNNAEEIIIVPPVTQTQPLIVATGVDNTPAADPPTIAALEVPPIAQQTAPSRGRSNEADDQRATTVEHEPTTTTAHNTIGAAGLLVLPHGHHRSKSAESARLNLFEDDPLTNRGRSSSF